MLLGLASTVILFNVSRHSGSCRGSHRLEHTFIHVTIFSAPVLLLKFLRQCLLSQLIALIFTAYHHQLLSRVSLNRGSQVLIINRVVDSMACCIFINSQLYPFVQLSRGLEA